MKSPIKRYPPVGFCIYCGSSHGKLADEHIIPEALGGTTILPKSSCKDCEKITTKFECKVARFMYGNFRIKLDYPSKRKKQKKRPTELPVHVVDNKKTRQEIHVPISDYPLTYLTAELPPPGLLLGIAPSDRSPEIKFNIKGDAASVNHTFDALSVDHLIIEHGFDWAAFFKQLAKIGHCSTFHFARGMGYESLLPDIILGKSDHLSYYVGGISQDSESEVMSANEVNIYMQEINSEIYLVARIQLLGKGTIPAYEVVTGRVPDPDVFFTAQTEFKNAI